MPSRIFFSPRDEIVPLAELVTAMLAEYSCSKHIDPHWRKARGFDKGHRISLFNLVRIFNELNKQSR